jgi:hypothetical protein
LVASQYAPANPGLQTASLQHAAALPQHWASEVHDVAQVPATHAA